MTEQTEIEMETTVVPAILVKERKKRVTRGKRLTETFAESLQKTLGFFKLHKDVEIPERKTWNAACLDLSYYPWEDKIQGYSATSGHFYREINQQDRSVTIMPGERLLLPTSLIADIPEGHSLRAYTRSSVGLKKGLNLPHGIGVIDSDYVHELFIPLYNTSQVRVKIDPGERLAQVELVKNLEYKIKEIKKQPETKSNRKGGFGSTNDES